VQFLKLAVLLGGEVEGVMEFWGDFSGGEIAETVGVSAIVVDVSVVLLGVPE
jgi:hypothetical protein